MVIDSDDEKALVKAIETVFHKATHVLCTRHLEENVKTCIDSRRSDQGPKAICFETHFWARGLIDASDALTYDIMTNTIENELAGISLKFR